MTNYEIALLVAPAATYLGALVLLLRIETRRQDSKTASLPGQLPEHAGKNVKPVRDPHVPDFSTPRDSEDRKHHIYDFFAQGTDLLPPLAGETAAPRRFGADA
jgi:hypothetical protein